MAIKQEIEKKEKRTCLYDKHISLGATMVTFGGFDMPLLYQYAGIAPEHLAVREKVGLFDVSHMGEVTVKGPEPGQILPVGTVMLFRFSGTSIMYSRFSSYRALASIR